MFRRTNGTGFFQKSREHLLIFITISCYYKCFVDLQIIQYEATEFHAYCWKSMCCEINKYLAFSRWGDV